MIGIYKIENTITNDLYIGSSINIAQRKRRHFKDLKRGIHISKFLQRSYNKYGLSAFNFEIIELLESSNDLLVREQYFLDLLKPTYNLCKVAGNSLGVKQTAEFILKNKLRNTNFGNGNSKLTEKDLNDIVIKRETMSQRQIAKEYNVHITTIQRVLNRNGIKTPNKVYDNNARNILSINGAKNLPNRSKRVAHCNSNGDILREYPSLTAASKELGISLSSIYYICLRKSKGIERTRKLKTSNYFMFCE